MKLTKTKPSSSPNATEPHSRSVQNCTQLTPINRVSVYKNRTAASGEQKPPEKNRRHPPENVKNRLTTMCRNAKEASDKTGKANRESRMSSACSIFEPKGSRQSRALFTRILSASRMPEGTL